MYEKKEKAELEPKVAKPVMEVNENDEETTIVLEEEIDFGIVEARSKINKRKNDESGQPPTKRKIFENIVSCGDDEETIDVETNDLSGWLVSVKDNTNTNNELKDDIVGPSKEPSRMKQLELSFVKKVTNQIRPQSKNQKYQIG